nr:unnamed protein product [Spirometra erinaceieuropaei]
MSSTTLALSPCAPTTTTTITTTTTTTTTITTTTTTTTSVADTDTADFSCPHCPRTFTSRIGLIGHLRIHRTETGEPVPGAPTYTHQARLNCPHCPRTFRHCMGLFGHMRIHGDLRVADWWAGDGLKQHLPRPSHGSCARVPSRIESQQKFVDSLVMFSRFINILKTHPKKSILLVSVSAGCANYVSKKYSEELLRRSRCSSLSDLGRERLPKSNSLYRVTVFLNPFAYQRQVNR